MIAGYDYLILRNGARRFWNRTRIAGATLLIAGGLLIGVGGAYYGYANTARADLDNYRVSAVELVPVEVQRQPMARAGTPSIVPEVSLLSGYSGYAPVDPSASLPDGFAMIDFSEEDALTTATAATSISVSAVEIDASVLELAIENLGDRRAYETPSQAVGHIPETSNAGEDGDAWFFGHMESPLIGEGEVFRSLQDVPGKLAAGEEVQIITNNGSEQFLYRVTGTRVVHEDDLTLTGDGGPNIHLVACFPRLVYDHRLIVDAELIASKANS